MKRTDQMALGLLAIVAWLTFAIACLMAFPVTAADWNRADDPKTCPA